VFGARVLRAASKIRTDIADPAWQFVEKRIARRHRDVPHRKSNTQVFDFRSEARTCAVPNELKNAMEGVFNKSV
jgi:hypothetical protein